MPRPAISEKELNPATSIETIMATNHKINTKPVLPKPIMTSADSP